jgi:hypothetical protein
MINTSQDHTCKTLRRATKVRIKFDPENSEHRYSIHFFNKNGFWHEGNCPFDLSWPFLSIPQQCMQLLIDYYTSNDSDIQARIGS